MARRKWTYMAASRLVCLALGTTMGLAVLARDSWAGTLTILHEDVHLTSPPSGAVYTVPDPQDPTSTVSVTAVGYCDTLFEVTNWSPLPVTYSVTWSIKIDGIGPSPTYTYECPGAYDGVPGSVSHHLLDTGGTWRTSGSLGVGSHSATAFVRVAGLAPLWQAGDTHSFSVVPEPATLSLLTLAGLALRPRRRGSRR